VFDRCAANADCSAQYPKLESVFYRLIDRFNLQPFTITVRVPGFILPVTTPVNGDTFVNILFRLLYSERFIPAIPGVIFAARDGKYDDLAKFYQAVVNSSDVSEGMYYSVQCGEDAAFTSQEAITTAAARVNRRLRAAFTSSTLNELAVCKTWNARKAASIENEAVQSDVPTLVFSGGFDPITPPAYGQLAASTLSKGYFYEFPEASHGVLYADYCPQTIAMAFLHDPQTKPDAACIKGMKPLAFK
jgi:pimeloyl-ACP methyl ester carboxylesterase